MIRSRGSTAAGSRVASLAMRPALGRVSSSVLAATALTACTAAGPTAVDVPPSTATSSPSTGVATDGVPGTELRAQSASLEVWALLWEPPPWEAGREVKVVWRATGSGDFSVVALGPDGQRDAPTVGPTPHTGSNWNRPGDEWGTFFRLEEPGDWVLRAQRGSEAATLTVTVTAE